MSDAKFHLVCRASILASGDSDDFGYVAPDEVVLVSAEALEQARRERDEARESDRESVEMYRRARDRAERAEADAARLREALREIAQGKSPDDVGCLADEWMLMAGRLVRIAREAIVEVKP